MDTVIKYEEKQNLNVLNISLNSHDLVSLSGNDLYFWKNRGNHYYFKLKISLIDFEKVIDFMDLYYKMSNGDSYWLPANLEMVYTLVPKVYYGQYYKMKSFCNFIKLAIDGDFKNGDFYLPFNPTLWRQEINKGKQIVEIKVYVNGKLSNKPLSYETAKKLGLIE